MGRGLLSAHRPRSGSRPSPAAPPHPDGEWDDREKPEPYWTGDLPFTGEAFRLRVLCFGRNSWQPEWRCTLSGGPEGARLEVRARCQWFTRILMCVWFGLLALLTLRLARPGGGWAWAVTLPFWAFGLGIGSLGFWRPERRARGQLCRLLEGTLE